MENNELVIESEEDVLNIFPELGRIEDKKLREETTKALLNAPSYFWVKPASSTGKHHPELMCLKHGLVLHTKKAFELFEMLSEPFEDSDSLNRDYGRAAILLHDLYKYGNGGKYTVDNHPMLAAKKLREYFEFPTPVIEAIMRHMGPYGRKKPLNQLSRLVYQSDYLSTQTDVYVEFSVDDERMKESLTDAILENFS